MFDTRAETSPDADATDTVRYAGGVSGWNVRLGAASADPLAEVSFGTNSRSRYSPAGASAVIRQTLRTISGCFFVDMETKAQTSRALRNGTPIAMPRESEGRPKPPFMGDGARLPGMFIVAAWAKGCSVVLC